MNAALLTAYDRMQAEKVAAGEAYDRAFLAATQGRGGEVYLAAIDAALEVYEARATAADNGYLNAIVTAKTARAEIEARYAQVVVA